MGAMSNEHLEQRERRDVIVAAGGWPVHEPEQTEDDLAPLALGSRERPRTDAPAVLDESPYWAGGVFYANPSDAAYARELLAARQAREEERRRASFAAFPGQLDEVREALDAVAAQRWAEDDAA